MIPADRIYLDPGDRWAGRYDPPRRCVVVTQWGPRNPQSPTPALSPSSRPWTTKKTGPRNVAVRYLDDASVVVIPFSRRLRRGHPAVTS